MGESRESEEREGGEMREKREKGERDVKGQTRDIKLYFLSFS